MTLHLEKSIVSVYQDQDENDPGGMGVYVGSNLILTAAHCLRRLPDAHIPFGDMVCVPFSPFAESDRADAVVIFADPCSDLAVLSEVNSHGSAPAHEQYKRFQKIVSKLKHAPVRLATEDPIDVRWLSHKNEWGSGRANASVNAGIFFQIEPADKDNNVEPGTSGSPLFDKDGCVIGIISSSGFGSEHDEQSANAVRLAAALPLWFVQELSLSDEC